MTLHVEISKVNAAATAWDTEHLNLDTAAKDLAGASPSGFTESVRGPVEQFLKTWERFAREAGQDAEKQADGLRKAAKEILEEDARTDVNAQLYMSMIEETR